MEYRKCGSSELELSAIGLGCWIFGGGEYWGPQDQKDVEEVVRSAVDAGINYFDTAEIYNDGRSETSLGKAIKGLSRDSLVIGSKVSPSNCYPGVLEEHCHASLRRLDTDYIDIYMIHWPIHPHSIRHFTSDESIINNPPDSAEAFGILSRLRDQGKIRHIGVSNFSRKKMISDIPEGTDVVLNELAYNLLCRGIEFDTLPYCQSAGTGILAYIALFQGILSGKYRSTNEIPVLLRRTRHFDSAGNPKIRHGEKGFEEETWKALEGIRAVAEKRGISMTELAAGWVTSNKAVTCSLMGARNARQLKEITDSVLSPLASDLVEELNSITDDLKQKMGNCFDYWESRGNDRTV